VREAVAFGIPPGDALVAATLSPASWHGLQHLGAVAPGYQADVLILPDLERFVPELVLKAGRRVEEVPATPAPEWTRRTVRIAAIGRSDIAVRSRGGPVRVIRLVPGQIVTEAELEQPTVVDGLAVADPGRDLVKVVVVERHLATGRVGLGFARGFGLQRGAFASTVAHDAHNIVVAGVDDSDIVRAVQRLAEIGGGLVVVENRGIRAELPLPVAGLLSDASADTVVHGSRACVDALAALGCTIEAPFQALAFVTLSVIPRLRLTDRGLVDVDSFELVPLEVDPGAADGAPRDAAAVS
jgi:adenine deaminase